MDMGTIKHLAIAVILIGSVCVAYLNKERLKKILMGKPEKMPKQKNESTVNAIDEVCQAFLLYVDNFQGILEPMYKASINKISFERKTNVFMEWDIRMSSIGNIPIGLKSWWATIIVDIKRCSDKELQDRALTVTQMILSCGIVRDQRDEVIVAQDTDMYYQSAKGEKWSVGQKLRTESPCWYMRSSPVRIIEKGYCEII